MREWPSGLRYTSFLQPSQICLLPTILLLLPVFHASAVITGVSTIQRCQVASSFVLFCRRFVLFFLPSFPPYIRISYAYKKGEWKHVIEIKAVLLSFSSQNTATRYRGTGLLEKVMLRQ